MKKREAVFDIETSYGLFYSYAHNMYEARLAREHTPIKLLCVSRKEIGKKPKSFASIDYPNYTSFLTAVHEDLSNFDLLIAHNGKKFDIRQLNVFFAEVGLPKIKHFPKNIIDTLTEARREWNLPSYSLKYLLTHFDLPRKLDPGGEERWFRCMAFNDDGSPTYPKDWKEMRKYCDGDVASTEALYLFMKDLGFIKDHGGKRIYTPGENCWRCSADFSQIQSRGDKPRDEGILHEYYCKSCRKRLYTDIIKKWPVIDTAQK